MLGSSVPTDLENFFGLSLRCARGAVGAIDRGTREVEEGERRKRTGDRQIDPADEGLGNKSGGDCEATQQRSSERCVAVTSFRTEDRGIRLPEAPSFGNKEGTSCPHPRVPCCPREDCRYAEKSGESRGDRTVLHGFTKTVICLSLVTRDHRA